MLIPFLKYVFAIQIQLISLTISFVYDHKENKKVDIVTRRPVFPRKYIEHFSWVTLKQSASLLTIMQSIFGGVCQIANKRNARHGHIFGKDICQNGPKSFSYLLLWCVLSVVRNVIKSFFLFSIFFKTFL